MAMAHAPSLTPPPITPSVTLPASTGEEAGCNFLDEVIADAVRPTRQQAYPFRCWPDLFIVLIWAQLQIIGISVMLRGCCDGGGLKPPQQFHKVQQKKRMVNMNTQCKSSQCVYLPPPSITSLNWWFNICSVDDHFQQANFPKRIPSLSSSSLVSCCCQLSAALVNAGRVIPKL